jgi:hypothetical protein
MKLNFEKEALLSGGYKWMKLYEIREGQVGNVLSMFV